MNQRQTALSVQQKKKAKAQDTKGRTLTLGTVIFINPQQIFFKPHRSLPPLCFWWVGHDGWTDERTADGLIRFWDFILRV